MRLARKILGRLVPYRWLFASALLQVLGIGLLELAKPWPLKIVVDDVLGGRSLGWAGVGTLGRPALLAVACLALVAIYGLLGVLSVTSNYATIKVGQQMVNDFRSELYAHLQRLSLAFHSRRQVGDLLYRLTSDTFAIQTLTMNGFFPVITSVVLLVGMLGVMLRLDWVLTLIALAVVPLLFGAIVMLSRRITVLATDARIKESAVWAIAQRTIGAIRVIQAFTTEEEEHRRFVATSGASLAANLRLYTSQTVYTAFVNVVVAAGTAAVLWFGVTHVLAGKLTVGEVLVFTSYLASLYAPINSLMQTYGLVQGARVGAERVFEILETAPDLRDGTRPLAREEVRGAVTFEAVRFGYDPAQRVLEGVDFHVRAGEVVAIVGATGAGKTTLVSLVPRFYDPTAGRVLFDGIDVRDFQLKALRQQVAMVLQPPLVFPTTVRDNIAYGRPDATASAIEGAAHVAQLDDFLERLPEGLDTVVGEAGATLSAGEQLRITIARAVLRDAPILILDEPTSALDATTEARVMQGLEALMAGRTTFVIAHRLSTVRRADVILVLDAGRIVEQGTFTELVARGGHFARLHRTQFGGEAERAASS
ncbi:MAG: ABC transporter ATP-binding protein [Deltaproteobacteria bacterium]|nr:MAG: ABC transporter ATP-binding protein [Deltaproteobacteria bacterium]